MISTLMHSRFFMVPTGDFIVLGASRYAGPERRRYRLTLADSPANTGTTGILPVAGSSYTVDIGCEEDWGDIQPMLPTDYPTAHPADWSHRVGLGNDADGHIEILCATDLATGRTYRNPHSWATHRVWCYVENYAA